MYEELLCVCKDCGECYGDKKLKSADWFNAVCDLCDTYTVVTDPFYFGNIKKKNVKK